MKQYQKLFPFLVTLFTILLFQSAARADCTDLASCREEKKVLARDLSVAQTAQNECNAKLEVCEGGKKPASAQATDKPKAPASPPAKPACAYDAKLENGQCVCSDVAIQTHWKGDQPGVIVKIVRQPKIEKVMNGHPVYACVATRDSVVALYSEMLRQFKVQCDVTPTVNAFGAPPEASQKLYPPVIDDGDMATRDDQYCGTFKAYLHRLESWKHDLESAGPDKDGQPAPFTVANWLIVWNRTLELADIVADHEKRLGHVERTYCHKDEKSGEWVNCPRASGPFAGGIVLQIPVVGGAWLRPGGTHTYTVTLAPQVIGLFNQHFGWYAKGYFGYGYARTSDRVPAGGGTGAYFSFDDERVFALSLGILAGAEPAVRGNDSFNAGGDLHLQIRPGNGNFLLDLGLVVGGSKQFDYYNQPAPSLGIPGPGRLLIAPMIGLGFDFYAS